MSCCDLWPPDLFYSAYLGHFIHYLLDFSNELQTCQLTLDIEVLLSSNHSIACIFNLGSRIFLNYLNQNQGICPQVWDSSRVHSNSNVFSHLPHFTDVRTLEESAAEHGQKTVVGDGCVTNQAVSPSTQQWLTLDHCQFIYVLWCFMNDHYPWYVKVSNTMTWNNSTWFWQWTWL